MALYGHIAPTASNRSGAKDVFLERDIYAYYYPHMRLDGVAAPTPLNFFNPKDFYYGRVDRLGDAIVPIANKMKRLKLHNRRSGFNSLNSDPIFVFDFVAHAFEKFREFMTNARPAHRMKDTPWEKMNPTRGWTGADFGDPYEQHMVAVVEAAQEKIINKKNLTNSVWHFDKYLRYYFDNYVPTILTDFPITKSGFITSKFNSPTQTGLCIEMSKDDHSKDFKKWHKWVADPMFDFFRFQAARYGFFVDQNAPWRIVANINSPIMAQAMAAHGTSKSDLFSTHYNKAMHEDIPAMRLFATLGWNLLAEVEPVITVPIVLGCGMPGEVPNRRVINVHSGRAPISTEQVMDNIGMFYWLKQYLIARLIEVKPMREVKEAQIKRIARNASYIDITLDFFAALRYINNYVRNFMIPIAGDVKRTNRLIDFADPETLKDPSSKAPSRTELTTTSMGGGGMSSY
tara:strand:+ start:2763 stop:4136 length:1374 start_codon:yes stop_codon:yes gene_type:complete